MNATCSAHAGATASFIGTTRNVFDGKEVIRLEYEAYVPMAIAELRKVGACHCIRLKSAAEGRQLTRGETSVQVCERASAKWCVKRMAIAHRTGVVNVREASVVIAVSSAHRVEVCIRRSVARGTMMCCLWTSFPHVHVCTSTYVTLHRANTPQPCAAHRRLWKRVGLP